MDIITLGNQTKLAKALKNNRIALYLRSMIPDGVIPLDGQFIDITNIPLLNNLPIHHLVKPQYRGLAQDFASASGYAGSVNTIIELPMNNLFLFGSDFSFIGFISAGATGDTHLVEQNPGIRIGGAYCRAVASTNSHSFAALPMSWVTNKLTNMTFFSSNNISGSNYQGSVNNIASWTAIPSVSDILTPLYTQETFSGNVLMINTLQQDKVLIIPQSTDNNPRVVLSIPNGSTIATHVIGAVPLDNEESAPIIFTSGSDKNSVQRLNVIDVKTGAFRIEKNKELALYSSGVVSDVSNGRIFVVTPLNGDTILYELVDVVDGVDIINPVTYQNPTLRVRASFMRKFVNLLVVDNSTSQLYVNIQNNNTNEDGSALHQNANTLAAIDLNTYKIEKLQESPTINRAAYISRDRSTMIIGTQRGYYIYNVNRKHYQLPKLPAPHGMVYGLTV